MSHTWGPTPDITARRALALADRKDLAGAARAMERQVGDRSENVEQVYKELNRRIQESAAHPEQESWEALRAASEWKMVGAGGNPKLGVEGGRLELQYHLAAKGEKAAPVTVNEAIHSKAAVYVQDSPALRNLDWSVDMQRSLQQAVEGDLATVVRLQRMDVAHFRPAKIYAPDDTAVLRKVNRPAETVSRAGQNAYRSYRSSECFGSPDGRVRAGCPEDQQAVYLVVPKGDARRYE
jgi:hypothetical protein